MNENDDRFITRKEHEEFEKRIMSENDRLKDEDQRQNRRLQIIEDNNKQINNLALSVQELATSVKEIAKETERLGERVDENINKLDERLTKLEGRDGERWRSVIGYLITAILSLLIGIVTTQIGL